MSHALGCDVQIDKEKKQKSHLKDQTLLLHIYQGVRQRYIDCLRKRKTKQSCGYCRHTHKEHGQALYSLVLRNMVRNDDKYLQLINSKPDSENYQ